MAFVSGSRPTGGDFMSVSTVRTPHPYIAEVRNSQEVTLYGSADLKYWQQRLLSEKLVPVEQDGKARLMISAVASRWLGVRFSEFSIVILANPAGHAAIDEGHSGYFLPTAYNTSRPFTFIEQRYFQTPYSYGKVDVQCHPTASFSLKQRAGEMIHAASRTLSTAPKTDEVWEGPIYLPPRPAKTRALGKVFYARLGGLTEIRPFDPAIDSLSITPTASEPVLGQLLDSGFAGQEWHIRSSATHARSQTYPRP
jgi:hypothetical protein